MGSCSWSNDEFKTYSKSMSRGVGDDGTVLLSAHTKATQLYTAKRLDPMLNPKGVIRECKDCEAHPQSIPVILALDVTGSMGRTAVEVSKNLGVIMTELCNLSPNVEFMIMGIGDFAYDEAPLQVSQFEADVRIAEQLDKLYFEGGGGPNPFESYSAAWMFAANQTSLDCWNRGKKGIIITIGDEILNPHIDRERYYRVTECLGDNRQNRDLYIYTEDIYNMVKDKYDLYHIDINHYSNERSEHNRKSFAQVIGNENVSVCTVEQATQRIVAIISEYIYKEDGIYEVPVVEPTVETDENGFISW